MKKLTICALLAAQILAASQPAAAASLDDRLSITDQRRAAFIGARLRVPFGGENSGRPRAALALTSVEHGQNADGRTRIRFSEGIELGLSPDRPLTLSIGGTSFAQRLAAAQPSEERHDNRERQARTGRTVLKGMAVVAIVGVAVVGGLYLALTVACDGNRCSE